ncbi:MAG: protein TolR [Thermodesulfobacteriota bacterium]
METGHGRRPMSQINVTPLVDVMLVLLIIFMITTPMMQQGIDVNLPEVEASNISATDEPIVISIDRRRRVYINDARIKRADLRRKIAAIHKLDPARTVLLRADERVPYGEVMGAMSDIRMAGIEKVGMVTEADGGRSGGR